MIEVDNRYVTVYARVALIRKGPNVFYLSRYPESYCRDYIVQFYTFSRHGAEGVAETRVRCSSGAEALRIARYELGDHCSHAYAWARPAVS